MMPSSSDTHDRKECYEHGAISFGVKHVKINDLINVVKNIG